MSQSAGNAVFLGYASQDAEAAKRICDTLRTAGVEVWLDQEGGLVGGDARDRKIREQISSCALFIPLVSVHTQGERKESPAGDGDDIAAQPNADALAAAVVLAAHGDMVGARSRLENHPAQVRVQLESQPSNAVLWSRLALMEALLGEKQPALQHARKAVELVPVSRDRWMGPSFRLELARVCAWVGEKEQATAELAYLLIIPVGLGRNFGRPNVHTLPFDPSFAPLRGDPRFEALLKDPKNNAPLF